MMRLNSIRAWCAIIAMIAAVLPATATAMTPGEYIESLARSAQHVVETVDGKELKGDQTTHFDMERFSRRCMIDHWGRLTEAQRTQFTRVFTESLKGRLDKMLRERTRGKNVTYTIGKARTGSDGVVTVPMTANVDDVSLTVLYMVVKKGDGYRLIDCEMDGVLLSRNYRGQFNYLMRKYGFAGLIERIERKTTLLANN